MSDGNLLKEFVEKIAIDRETVEIAPRNGIKHIRDLLWKLEDLISTYTSAYEDVMTEIKNRYDEKNLIVQNPEIEEVQNEILEINNLVLSEEGQTSFEKMGLDMLTYNINGYYKKDLNVINNDIYMCIKKFREVGIPISAEDFNISEFVNEYMNVLIAEADKGALNSEKVKSAFDKVYWKCSDIIIQILMNIRLIYDLNEKKIDEFYKTKTEQVLNALSVTQQEVEDKKEELIIKLNELKSIDGRLLLDSFTTGQYSIMEYKESSYISAYKILLSDDVTKLSPEEKADKDSSINKLYTNLIEYSGYLQYKFISDEILKIKKENDKEKEATKDKKEKKGKKVNTTEGNIEVKILEINKLNSEISDAVPGKRKGLFAKKVDERVRKVKVLERDNKILELKDLYAKFDNEKIKNKVSLIISDTSNVYDLLKIASYYYGFLAKAFIRKNPEILDSEIAVEVEKYRNFVRLHQIAVINHVGITEKKDISIVIKDKYKLSGLTLTKDNVSEEGLDDLIKLVDFVNYYNNIQKSNIPLEDIVFIMDAKPLLEK